MVAHRRNRHIDDGGRHDGRHRANHHRQQQQPPVTFPIAFAQRLGVQFVCTRKRGRHHYFLPISRALRTSVMTASTEAASPPKTSTLTRLMSPSSFFFCSMGGPSIVST